tara:strand:+ start:74 stop:475 length:402 start_codon:yes stop_codon:yes gene_type:complete
MLTQKQRRKLVIQGYKIATKSKFSTQDEIDLSTVKKINDFAVDGKIAVLKSDECFYDSHDFNVQGYVSEYTRLIPASYTAYRLFLKQAEYCADQPYHVEIVEPIKMEKPKLPVDELEEVQKENESNYYYGGRA